jgi:hypothetical protein
MLNNFIEKKIKYIKNYVKFLKYKLSFSQKNCYVRYQIFSFIV